MFKQSTETGLTWEVRANGRAYHKQNQKKSFLGFRWGRCSDNKVRSHKYSVLTFLPLTLFEQFQRPANLYFLFIMVLQSIPAISSIPWYVSVIPLLLVVCIRGVKDLIKDMARRRSDSEVNSRPCDVLISQSFSTAQWQDVCIGDVLRICKDQVLPADLLLICTSEPHSMCWVETADIDGETNLKHRQAPDATHSELTSDPTDEMLAAFDGVVLCEEPNNQLYSFKGQLRWQGARFQLDSEHLLLRGTVLRNTDSAYGLVIYTAGADSKILKNSGKPRLKTTQKEKVLNRIVIGIVLSLLLVTFLMAIGNGVFTSWVMSTTGVLSAHVVNGNPIYTAFLVFWSYTILLSPSIPIALYIMLEMVHSMHSLFIGWDIEMYWQQADRSAEARSTTLTEELGQVEYLLSDKTGTLTQNRLQFRQCCIAGEIYGDISMRVEDIELMNLSWNPFSRGDLFMSAPTLLERLRVKQCPVSRQFLTALAVCNTVTVLWKEDTPIYHAASPDEEALVGAARELGWVLFSRTRDSLTVSELGVTQTYQLLALQEFTSQRRRMSALVREPGGGLKLYCKGADMVILERLQRDCPHRAMNERALKLFSQACLRTLCVAVRSVPEELWEKWSKTLALSTAMATIDRDELLERLNDEMEQELQLLGVTAIEDRLQEGVPETITMLQQAGIKVWVLTGDKKETAVNIGYSCKLLDPETRLLEWQDLRQILQSQDPEISFLKARQTEIWAVDKEMVKAKTAIVLTGSELEEFDQTPDWRPMFMRLASQCQSVLCCRVTPSQKADLVSLVRNNTSSITMCIGDGANDVNMIKTAHVGVGLTGVEGSQAVQNADFALSQFRFLQRLLLVHGHWSYQRISVFLRYFLYKTCGFALVQLWFGLFNGFSAQSAFETWFIGLYTALYSAPPILCVAFFEQDVSAESCLKWPELYKSDQRQEISSTQVLAVSLVYAVYTSLVLFFLPCGVFHNTGFDYQTMAVTLSMAAVFSINIEIILLTRYWTKFNVAALCCSFALFFSLTRGTQTPFIFETSPSDYYFIGASDRAFKDPVVWLTAVLTACTAVLPSMAIRALSVILTIHGKHKVHSTSCQLVELRAKLRGTSLLCSSYALSRSGGHVQRQLTTWKTGIGSVDELVTASKNTDSKDQHTEVP